MTVQKPKTQAEAAIMRVMELDAEWAAREAKCRQVASDNANHEEHFAYTEGIADTYADAREQLKDAIGIAVWTRLERVPTAIEPATEEEAADE